MARSTKLVGLRIKRDTADRYEQLAKKKGISVNKLICDVLSKTLRDPGMVAVQHFEKELISVHDKVTDLGDLIGQIDLLMRLQDQTEAELRQLEREKPGLLEFDLERLKTWQHKVTAIREKSERLQEKISDLIDRADQAIQAEYSAPKTVRQQRSGTADGNEPK